MSTRSDILSVRINQMEREIVKQLAEREERELSDFVRLLIRREARAAGIMPTNDERRPDRSAGVSIGP